MQMAAPAPTVGNHAGLLLAAKIHVEIRPWM